MEEEVDIALVKGRAVKGVISLTGRTLIINLISFFSQGLLWAFLDPSQFGVFLIVSATVNFLSYFADIGLGAALIQKLEKPEEKDYRTVFTVQEILVFIIFIIILFIGPFLVRSHSLNREGLLLLYALGISFLMASFKNIPSIKLERKLEFGKFVIPQVLENMVYAVSVVFFAWRGFGITSFTYAVLLRGIIGVIAIYILSPWLPAFGFNFDSFKKLIKFGIPYQLNNFLATLKDDGMTVVLGSLLGASGVGILGTAQKLAQYPLRFFMDNVTKVTFPAFSRMQKNKEELSKTLSRSIFFICTLVFPSLIGLIMIFPNIVALIPKYDKWAPAFVPLVYLSVNSLWAAATTQLTNFLNSIGRIKVVFKLMIMWTILTWFLVPLFSRVWGINGAALAYSTIGFSSVVVFMIVGKIIRWHLFRSVMAPFISAVFMGLIIGGVKMILSVNSYFSLAVIIIVGIMTYFGFLHILVGKSLEEDVKKTIQTIIRK